MFWYNKIFDLKHCLVRVLFPEEIDGDYSQLPVFGRWGVRTVVRWRVNVFVSAFGSVISGHEGVRFRSCGANAN